MAKKKVIGEDGKTYVMKEKKPIYKRVWFWILAVMILVAFASSLGGGDESASGGETIDNSSQSEKKQESEEKIE
ncbi:MAG: phage immunity protein, partial [Enterococcus aquimarinus]